MIQRSIAAATADEKALTKSTEKSKEYAEQHDVPHYSVLNALPIDFFDMERRRYYIAQRARFPDVYKKRGLEGETQMCIVFVVIPEAVTKQSAHAVNFPDIQDLTLSVIRVPSPSITTLATKQDVKTPQTKAVDVVTMNVVSYEFERPQRAVGLIVVEPPFKTKSVSMHVPLDLTT